MGTPCTPVTVRPSRNQCSSGRSPLAMATKLARRASDASRSYWDESSSPGPSASAARKPIDSSLRRLSYRNPKFIAYAKEDARAASPCRHRRVRQFLQPLGEGDEGPGEVAAVHGRDVPGIERRQARGVVPVVEVPLEPLQPLHRGERGVHPGEELLGLDEPQVVGGEHRQEPHADVGRRGPVRHLGFGDLLVVVRWQPVVVGPHEGLEEAPGLPGHAEEVGAVLRTELARRRGAAQRVGDERRRTPERQDGQGHPEGIRPERRHQQQARARDDRAGRHLGQEGTGTGLARPPCPSGRARRCGLPFQQPAPRHHEPDQGDQDGVDHLVGLVGEERELQEDARQPASGVLPEAEQEGPPGLLGRRTGDRVQHQREEGERGGGDDERGPERGASRQDRPGGEEQGDGGGGEQAAPQVVEDLPARDHRQAVSPEPAAGGDERQEPGQDLPVATGPAVLPAARG